MKPQRGEKRGSCKRAVGKKTQKKRVRPYIRHNYNTERDCQNVKIQVKVKEKTLEATTRKLKFRLSITFSRNSGGNSTEQGKEKTICGCRV